MTAQLGWGWDESNKEWLPIAVDSDGNLLVDATAFISDTVFGPSWNGVTTIAASKNAIYDKISIMISDTVYGSSWNGVTDIAPSKNAVYDKIESIGASLISDIIFGSSWNAVTTIAPSKNAVYDKVNNMISDTGYGIGWNGVVGTAASKNALYDKFETMVSKTLFDAGTFLYATSDNMPQAKTDAQVLAILSGDAAAVFSWNSQNLTGIVDLTMSGELVVTSGLTATGVAITLTPSAPIGAANAEWDGFKLDASALDPSEEGVELHGIHLDFSSVSLVKSPHMDGIEITMPVKTSSAHFFHALHLAEGSFLHDYTTRTAAATLDVMHDLSVDARNQHASSEIHFMDCRAIGASVGQLTALAVGQGIDVIHQHIGTWTSFDQTGADAEALRVTSGPTYTASVDGLSVFVADNDAIWFCSDAGVYGDLQVIMDEAATKDAELTFHYWNDSSAWIEFFPMDDTEGFQRSGSIVWESDDFTNWNVSGDPASRGVEGRWIKITRTRTGTVGSPSITTIKYLAGAILYGWDYTAALTIASIGAFTLTGKLTAGASEIEGSNFDINGGDMTGVTISGGLTWNAAQDFNSQNLTNLGDLTASGSFISTGGNPTQTGKFFTGDAGNTVLSFSGDNFDIRAGSGSSASQNVMRVTSAKEIGIGTNNPGAKLEILSTGNQLKLSFDGTDNVIFAVDTNGVLTITPSGAAVDFASKNLTGLGTLSAFTLGGTVTLNAQVFDAGAVNLEVFTTGANKGLVITSTQDGALGVVFVAVHDSASPTIGDVLFSFGAFGGDSAANLTGYGSFGFAIASPTHPNEEAYFFINLIDGGVDKRALTLDAAGNLSVDGKGTFGTGGVGGAAGEGHITILPNNYNTIGQGTWAHVNDNSYFLAAYFYNSTTADADEVSYKMYLAAGTYTFRIQANQRADAPIVDIYIDASEVGSFDLYDAVGAFPYTVTITGIIVATSGLKTFKLVIDGKHGSSSNYLFQFQEFAFWRTA